MTDKQSPNPNSKILASAIVGGAGLMLPIDSHQPPPGMGVVLLYVPLHALSGKSALEVQADMGIPWSKPNGEPPLARQFPHERSSK